MSPSPAMAAPIPSRRPISSPRLRLCLWGGLLLWCCGFAGIRTASAQQDTKPVVREVEVPASQPQLWPMGVWQPVPRDSYRAFLADLERPADAVAAPVAVLESVTLEGTLAGDSLIGTLDGSVTLPAGNGTGEAPKPGLVDLAGTGLALSNLTWNGRPAVWGIGPEEKLQVLTAPPERRLMGQWALRGHPVFDTLEFRVAGLPALASRVRLTLPAAWNVTSDVPTHREAGATEDSRLWTIDLGHRRKARITLQRPGKALAAALPPACEVATVLSVTRAGIDSVADLNIFGALSGRMLELDVPRELQIASVSLGEISLRIRREPGEKTDRLLVELPDLEGETRTTFRIRGTQPVRWGSGNPAVPGGTAATSVKPVTVREARLGGAPLLRKSLTLQVDRPMELQSLHQQGLQQTDISADGVRETYVFEATAGNTDLQIAVSEPAVRLVAECWTLADLRGESPVVWAVWSLQSTAGEKYSFDAQVPEPWEVVRVVPVADTPESSLAQWNFEKKGTQGGVLSIEFRRGLTPQTPKRILLELRGQPLASQPDPGVPVLVPSAARDAAVYAALWLPEPLEPRLPLTSAWRKGTIEDFPPGFFQLGGTLGAVRSSPSGGATGPELNFDQATYLIPDSRKGITELRVGPRRVPAVDTMEPRIGEPRPATSPDASPPSPSRLTVTTQLGAPGVPDHIHSARFSLIGLTRLGDLSISLPAGLRPVSIQDDGGEVAFAINDGRLVFGDPQRRTTALGFEYRTAASPGWFLATETMAFPQLSGFSGPLLWRIDLKGQRAFLDTDFPWSIAAAEQVPFRWWQILGPLARRPGERIFNPLSRADWRSLVSPTPQAAGGVEEILHLAPDVPEQVTLRTYLVPRIRTLAWALFLGCLLLGALARRARLRLIRQVGFYSMALFVPLAWFLPPLYGIQMGAIVCGLSLIYVIPRAIVVRDQFWRPRTVPRVEPGRATTVIMTGTLLVGVMLTSVMFRQRAVAQEAPAATFAAPGSGPPPARPSGVTEWKVLIPTEDGQPQSLVHLDPAASEAYSHWKRRRALPAYLLESARYTVVDDSGRLAGKAEIHVTRLEMTQPVTVRLPFDHVTLEGGASCQVDGQLVRVRPAADGRSILVPLPERALPIQTDAASAGDAPSPEKLRIALDFLPRLDPAQPDRMDVLVPAAGDTRFSFRSNGTDPSIGQTAIESIGPISTPQAGAWTTSLGAAGRLAVAWPQRAVAAGARDLSALSLVEITPLSLKVRTRVELPPSGEGRGERTLWIPADAVVEEVTGTAIDRHQASRDPATGEQRIDVRFSPRGTQERVFVDVQYRLPFDATAETLSIPVVVRVGTHPFQHHRIGLLSRGLPMLSPMLRGEDSAQPLAVDEFIRQQPDELIWPAPDHCLDQPQPGPIVLSRSASKSPRTVRIRQGVIVDRSQTRWTALVELQPRVAPLLSHAFKLDPRITLTSLSVEQDGAERLVRTLRRGDRLELFVRSQSLDRLTIRAEGTISGDRLNWSSLPALGLAEESSGPAGETLAADMTVRNESGWLLETEELFPTGAVVPHQEGTPKPVVFDMLSAAVVRFRLRPGPDAAEARSWIRVAPLEGQVSVTWHYDITPVDGPLHIVTGRIPGTLAAHVVSSSVPIRTETGGGPANGSGKPAGGTVNADTVEGVFTLAPSAPTPQHNELTIHALFPLPSAGTRWTIPEVAFDSARVVERRLVAPRSWPMVPVAGSATTVNELRPRDLPPAWRNMVRSADYEMFSGRSGGWQFDSRIDAPSTGQARTPLVEAVVWQRDGEPLRGQTRILAIAEETAPVRIAAPPGVRITRVRQRGRLRSPNSTEEEVGQVVVRIDPARSPEEIVVEWQRELPDRRPQIEVPRPIGQETVLVTVIPANQQVTLYESGTPLTPFEGTLAHFGNLLDVIRLQQTRAWLFDDPLLAALRQTERNLRDELGQESAEIATAARERAERLLEEWKDLQKTLPVNAPLPVAGGAAPHRSGEGDLMTELVATDPQFHVGRFFAAGVAAPRLKWSASRRTVQMGIVISCGVALLVLLRRLDHLQRRWEAAEWVANRAFLAMFGLGLVWWLLLTPSVLGLAIVAATALVKLLHVATHRRVRRLEAELSAASSAES